MAGIRRGFGIIYLEEVQATVNENSADVGSMNDLIGYQKLKVNTLKKQNQYDVNILYTQYFGWPYQPSSGVRLTCLNYCEILAGIRRGLDSIDKVPQKTLEASFAPPSQTS